MRACLNGGWEWEGLAQGHGVSGKGGGVRARAVLTLPHFGAGAVKRPPVEQSRGASQSTAARLWGTAHCSTNCRARRTLYSQDWPPIPEQDTGMGRRQATGGRRVQIPRTTATQTVQILRCELQKRSTPTPAGPTIWVPLHHPPCRENRRNDSLPYPSESSMTAKGTQPPSWFSICTHSSLLPRC